MDKDSGLKAGDGGDDTMLHIVSWMDSLDLRMLTVLANSTLSSPRYPEHVHFHFYTPKGNDDKVSYFKLKVLFPHSNLKLLGQEEVKTAIMKAYSLEDYAGPSMDQIAPFVIPIVHPWIRKFIYVSPNVIMKGGVEELVGVSLRHYAVGIAEDCSKRLCMSVNSEILDAIQRSASKPWVSRTPYAKNACMPELSLILIDGTKIEKDLMEAILWWSIVLNSRERRIPDPAIALALYNRHLKLPGSWSVSNLTSSEMNNRTLVLRYDKVMNMGLRPYLQPMSDQILGS